MISLSQIVWFQKMFKFANYKQDTNLAHNEFLKYLA